jgi:hypothetical protein
MVVTVVRVMQCTKLCTHADSAHNSPQVGGDKCTAQHQAPTVLWTWCDLITLNPLNTIIAPRTAVICVRKEQPWFPRRWWANTERTIDVAVLIDDWQYLIHTLDGNEYKPRVDLRL